METINANGAHAAALDTGDTGASTLLVECGCGVGNAVFPLLTAHLRLAVCGVDLSRRAIEFARADPRYIASNGRCQAWVADLSITPLEMVGDPRIRGAGEDGRGGSVDILLLCFVLSAVPSAPPPQFFTQCGWRSQAGWCAALS